MEKPITIIFILVTAFIAVCTQISFATEIHGGINLTTNFVYRGISYSDNKQAIQGFIETKGENNITVGVAGSSWYDQVSNSHGIIIPYVKYTKQIDIHKIETEIKYRNYFGEPSYDWFECLFSGTYKLSPRLSTKLEVAISPDYMRSDGFMYNTEFMVSYAFNFLFLNGYYGRKDVNGDSFTNGFTDKYWGCGIGIPLHKNALVEFNYSDTNSDTFYPADMNGEKYFINLKFGF